MKKFTEEDFHELSDNLDFSYTNIARVANNKLKEWNAELKAKIESSKVVLSPEKSQD